MNRAVQQAIVTGIGVGFAYQLGLAGAQIAVCERSRAGQCSAEWDKGFTVSSGLLSTLLAYFIDSPSTPAIPPRKPRHVRSSETDPTAPPS
jgi:hypothetical protein